jgi:hypothetical protein
VENPNYVDLVALEARLDKLSTKYLGAVRLELWPRSADGWWLRLIYCERKILLAGWWPVAGAELV